MKRRLYLATPMRDHQVAGARELSMIHLVLESMGAEFEIAPPLGQYDEDVVRVRSRYANAFLATSCTDILWIDADMSFAPAAVKGMLESEHDFVACPYPKKRIDWPTLEKLVAAGHAVNLEAEAYHYAFQMLEHGVGLDPVKQTLPIASIGFGLALTSRKCIDKMTRHYAGDLGFDDVVGGKTTRSVALFFMMLRDRELLPEDVSFCYRWRSIGGELHAYLGPGSPVDHVGSHVYRGHIEAFGGRR